MAFPETPRARAARDDFERYYAEKIWEWIPAVYRHEDGIADEPGVLRALVEILARQAAVARRSVDRLWEDQFIDFCDDWAISYLGDLVGTRLVHELNRRGRRVDVAKTLFYRRRKGTPVVMEALIRDVTGWEGAVVESFRRLARTRHRLDPEPARLAGRVTRTPPGGFADLRRVRGGELVDGPFDEYFHTPDVRRFRGLRGRYNIPKLSFHLFRLRAFEVRLATPADLGERRFTFDPSGRDVPLFRPARRPDPDAWRPVAEWELPAPIPCRLLAAETRRLVPGAVSVLVGADGGEPPFEPEELLAGNLEDWGAVLTPPAGRALVVDPERGRFLLLDDPADPVFVPRYHYGFSGPAGAGTYDRRNSVAVEGVADLPGGALAGDGDELEPGPITGFSLPADGVHQLVNSKTYVPDPPAGNVVVDVDHLCLQAKNRERPYLRLVPGDDGESWTFEALAKPPDPDPAEEADRRLLSLEGIWLGVVPATVEAQTLGDPADAPTPVGALVVLEGVFDRVEIRHSTLDPGGERARVDPLECTPVPYVVLEIRGQVEELVVERSIVGPIREATSGADPCSVGRIVVRDSIVHSLDPAVPAIATRVGEVRLERTTVFGDVRVDRLYASEALVQGRVVVADSQHGCFRFSAADDHPDNRLPPRFESHLFAGGVPNHVFTSRRFGDPGYAQLGRTAPATLVRGGENGSEIGAFNRLFDPIKLADLRAKVEEFMPFGLVAQLIRET